jgi:hypothetical protein
MPSQFKTPTSFPDFDRLIYKASFVEGRVVVKRMQGYVRRGKWEFEFSEEATWVCVKASDPWVKGNSDTSYSTEFIPEPVALKAKEFITAKLAVKAQPKD